MDGSYCRGAWEMFTDKDGNPKPGTRNHPDRLGTVLSSHQEHSLGTPIRLLLKEVKQALISLSNSRKVLDRPIFL